MTTLPILSILLIFSVGTANGACKTVTVSPTFNLTNFVNDGAKWYIHQQMPVVYLPAKDNYCVTADYKFTSATGVHVHNYANADKVNGKVYDSDDNIGFLGGICAHVVDKNLPAKLSVGPCRIPSWIPGAAGPYWVVASGPSDDAPYEWALVSGGQPTKEAPDGSGCSTGEGVNNSGLWIFLRSQKRDENLIQKIRKIAQDAGFDLSVLNDVDHVGCTYPPPSPKEAPSHVHAFLDRIRHQPDDWFAQ